MGLSNFFRYIFPILLSASISAEIKLPEISTKQSINNLRFISSNGRFTFYQRRSGSLLLSTNYKVEEVLKGSIGTHYTVSGSKERKYHIIEQSLNYHTYLSVRKLKKIFITPYGKNSPILMGEGIDSKLHLNDSWISYYKPYQHILVFKNVETPSISFEIKIQNIKNPYFVPHRVLLSSTVVLFSDLNKNGTPGLISFNRTSGKSLLLIKAENVQMRYELCSTDQHIYIGNFSLNKLNPFSSISLYKKANFNLGKGRIVYDNNKNDIGQMICNHTKDKIFFIKDMSEEYGGAGFEASVIDTKTKKVKILSSLKWVNSIINMDERLLLPYRGSFYVLKGDNNILNKDNLLTEEKKEEKDEKKVSNKENSPEQSKKDKKK
ncbi:hypothetical protein A9Q84_05865 [Halobacteriovorax marinus]|uniref:Uncharacterized protein n=1 Tax=Halobacteriovorax marinus TaxID=97084 RepID=A0A1Y5FBK8_9BACT|nr:hypothetical protein A9Q84_05865 [Halobacteriovorax marinus]